MPLALKDDTLLWNQHLDDVTKKDFNKLQDIFINRNRPLDILNFLSIAKSFKTLQGPHEKFSSCTWLEVEGSSPWFSGQPTAVFGSALWAQGKQHTRQHIKCTEQIKHERLSIVQEDVVQQRKKKRSYHIVKRHSFNWKHVGLSNTWCKSKYHFFLNRVCDLSVGKPS